MQQGSVLIVATAFAPKNVTGAVRTSKFAKYLIRQGYTVTVITPPVASGAQRDDTLWAEEFDQLRLIYVEHSPWFIQQWTAKRDKVLRGRGGAALLVRDNETGVLGGLRIELRRMLHFCFTIIKAWDWSRRAVRSAKKDLKGESFDAILSSYPGLGAMWVGRALRRRRFAKMWIADFRDRMDYHTESNIVVRGAYRFLQWLIVRRADYVVGVSRGVLRALPRQAAHKSQVLSNGFDPDDVLGMDSPVDALLPPKYRLCYAGSLQVGTRDVSIVFHALREIIERGVITEEELEFGYAGKDVAILRQQARPAALDGIVNDYGYVPREESLQLQSLSDAVVVATWNTSQDQGIMTGKIFEAFLLRKPILGIVAGSTAQSEFSQVVRAVGAGHVHEEGTTTPSRDFDTLCGFLTSEIEAWRRHEPRGARYNSHVLEYAYPAIVAKLGRLIGANKSGLAFGSSMKGSSPAATG